VRCLLFI